VPAGALGVERTKQRNIEGWVARKRGKTKSASAARRTRAKKPNK
jgi:bifunctional UDP-N-acetylglucosamine pyrophosphorylase / glucosamine-1-phosphate N-acetyltransferase